MNQNTVIGIQNLPAQAITSGTETALAVPAQGVAPGTGYPSPVFAAGNGLFIAAPADVVGECELDCHPFRIRVAGKFFTGASSTFQSKLYWVPQAIAAAQTAGVLANDSVIMSNAASAAVTGWANFVFDVTCMWDSSSLKLDTAAGISMVAGATDVETVTSPVTTTLPTTGVVNILNFIPSFTFGTANAGNFVQVTEFVIERV